MYRVLVVDDMKSWIAVNSKLVNEFLGENVQITVASSALEADSIVLESINKPFDLILTDLQMESDFLPKHAGEWLVEKIKTYEQYKNVFIILISASSDIKDVAARNKIAYISKAELIKFPEKLAYSLQEENFIMAET